MARLGPGAGEALLGPLNRVLMEVLARRERESVREEAKRRYEATEAKEKQRYLDKLILEGSQAPPEVVPMYLDVLKRAGAPPEVTGGTTRMTGPSGRQAPFEGPLTAQEEKVNREGLGISPEDPTIPMAKAAYALDRVKALRREEKLAREAALAYGTALGGLEGAAVIGLHLGEPGERLTGEDVGRHQAARGGEIKAAEARKLQRAIAGARERAAVQVKARAPEPVSKRLGPAMKVGDWKLAEAAYVDTGGLRENFPKVKRLFITRQRLERQHTQALQQERGRKKELESIERQKVDGIWIPTALKPRYKVLSGDGPGSVAAARRRVEEIERQRIDTESEQQRIGTPDPLAELEGGQATVQPEVQEPKGQEPKSKVLSPDEWIARVKQLKAEGMTQQDAIGRLRQQGYSLGAR